MDPLVAESWYHISQEDIYGEEVINATAFHSEILVYRNSLTTM